MLNLDQLLLALRDGVDVRHSVAASSGQVAAVAAFLVALVVLHALLLRR